MVTRAEHLLRRVLAAGWRVELGERGPVLQRAKAESPALPGYLLEAIKTSRAEVIAFLTASPEWEAVTCPLCFAWVRTPSDPRCNPEARPLEYLTVGEDGEAVRTVVSKCHFAG